MFFRMIFSYNDYPQKIMRWRENKVLKMFKLRKIKFKFVTP